MFLWVANFQGLTAGFAHLPKLSRTFIAGYICLTKNKILVFHPGWGGSNPSCFTQHTYIYLFYYYATVSLNFGHRPIFELTIYSPRMMNNQYHAHTPYSTPCPLHMKCEYVISCYSCYMHNKSYMQNYQNMDNYISTYNSHRSKEHIST